MDDLNEGESCGGEEEDVKELSDEAHEDDYDRLFGNTNSSKENLILRSVSTANSQMETFFDNEHHSSNSSKRRSASAPSLKLFAAVESQPNLETAQEKVTGYTAESITESAVYTSASVNQSFFLRAVFSLIRNKLELEAQMLANLRLKFKGLPLIEETLMFGQLRRSEERIQRPRFVVVSAGKLTYVPLTNWQRNNGVSVPGASNNTLSSSGSTMSSIAQLLMSGKQWIERKDVKVKCIRLHPQSRCVSVNKKPGKFCFRIIEPISITKRSKRSAFRGAGAKTEDTGIKYVEDQKNREEMVWSAQSEVQRVRWMNAIEDAAAMQQPENENQVEHINLSWMDLENISERVRNSTTRADYLKVLGDAFGVSNLANTVEQKILASVNNSKYICNSDDNATVCTNDEGECVSFLGPISVIVPMQWVYSLHDYSKSATPLGPSNIEQIFRDMRRDCIYINDRLYQGWLGEQDTRGNCGSSRGYSAGPGICAMVCGLAQEIERHYTGVALTEEESLILAYNVLLSCNRTHAGGNTFDAVSFLLGNPNIVMIATDSETIDPIRIRVYKAQNDASQSMPLGNVGSSTSSFRSSSVAKDVERKVAKRRIVKRMGVGKSRSSMREMKREPSSDDSANNGIISQPETFDSVANQKASYSGPKHGITFPESQKLLGRRNNKHMRQSSEPITCRRTPGSNGPRVISNSSARVEVQVHMVYKAMDCNFEDESTAVWARISATFKRTFALVGQCKAVALGQGSVSLELTYQR